MRTHQLKINFNNLKHDIERDYFKFRDIFYRCLVANLAIFHITKQPLLHNTVLEDAHHNQLLHYLINKQASCEEIIAQISDLNYIQSFLDTNVYIEEFILLRHVGNVINLYDMSIDDSYNVVITNKQLKTALPLTP